MFAWHERGPIAWTQIHTLQWSTSENAIRHRSASCFSIQLVEASTIPARKGRFLEATVDTSFEEGQELLFETKESMLKELGISCQESLLAVQPTGKLLIPLQNYGAEQISLDPGILDIGEVECFEGNTFMPEPEPTANQHTSSDKAIACAHVTTNEMRQSSLESQLNLPQSDTPTVDQPKQLETLNFILDYSDIFSVSNSDLGQTSIVQHTIDSGDHAPIKQHPRRMPFIQRSKVIELVDDMIDGGHCTAFNKRLGQSYCSSA